MPHTDLPTEIWLLIIAEIRLSDILSFSETCRQFRTISRQRVQQYRKREAQYSKCSINVRTPLDILIEVRNDPESIPFRQRLECYPACPMPEIFPSAHRSGYNYRKYGKTGEEAVWKSIDYFNHSKTQEWKQLLEIHHAVPCKTLMPLLLASLSELRQLVIGCFCAIDLLLLHELIERARVTSKDRRDGYPLAKLWKVRIDPIGPCCPNRRMEILLFFMDIPSMRHIEATDITSKGPLMMPMTTGSSNVTSLSFFDSTVLPQVIFELLTAIHTLTSFTYEARVGISGYQDSTFKVLHEHASGTLKHLTLYAKKGEQLTSRSFSLLNDFKNIKSLGLSATLVMDQDLQSGLWEVLPTTIETLNLYADSKDRDSWLEFINDIDRIQTTVNNSASIPDNPVLVTLQSFPKQRKGNSKATQDGTTTISQGRINHLPSTA